MNIFFGEILYEENKGNLFSLVNEKFYDHCNANASKAL